MENSEINRRCPIRRKRLVKGFFLPPAECGGRLLVGTGTPELKPLCAERSHQCTNGGKGLLVCGQWTLLL